MATGTPSERTERAVAAFGGITTLVAFAGVGLAVFQTATLGVVAGLFSGLGTYLFLPPLLEAEDDGALPPADENSVFGTGLHPAAAGFALSSVGIITLAGGFVFENPAIGVVIGAVVGGVEYAVVSWGLAESSADAE